MSFSCTHCLNSKRERERHTEGDEKTLSEILITGHTTMAENSFGILD